MNIIVVGCGRLGAGLAYRLFKQGHHVVVIDDNDPAFDNLPSEFKGRTVHGDALNKGILERAGIEQVHGLATVTSSDAVNAVVAHLARSHYKVPFVVSRNYDPNYFSIHEAFKLQTVSSTMWGAQRIEELLYHGEVHTIFSAGNGEVEIYEVIIPESWQGASLQELILENECVPIALTRGGTACIPSASILLETGDLIQVGATLEGVKNIRRRLVEKTGGV